MGYALSVDGWMVVLSLFLGGGLLLVRWWRRGESSHLLFSDLEGFGEGESLRAKLAFLPGMCRGAAFAFLLIALPNPRLSIDVSQDFVRPPSYGDEIDEFEELRENPTEGVALYLVLDRSGSMEAPMNTRDQRRVSRIDALKQVTTGFIRGDEASGLGGRPNDMIGLVSFARVANVLCPLTLDRGSLLKQVQELELARSVRENGTAIGYALFKTANLIAATRHYAEQLELPPYQIKSSAIVLVTDGLPMPHPHDHGHKLRSMSVLQAAETVVEHDITLYIVYIEPMVNDPRATQAREEMRKAAEMTGGRFYAARDGETLKAIYREVDRLERVELPGKRLQQAHVRQSNVTSGETIQTRELLLYPYFVSAGLGFLFLGVLLQTTYLRRVL